MHTCLRTQKLHDIEIGAKGATCASLSIRVCGPTCVSKRLFLKKASPIPTETLEKNFISYLYCGGKG